MEEILKYFGELTPRQIGQLEQLDALYRDWNAKINVISRKDIDNLYLHHVLHSMAIAKCLRFEAGTQIADIGTGGGFPGIPMAILFPECEFHLIDSIGKKLTVASAVAEAIGLENVRFTHERMEDEKGLYDFAISRAVMPLGDLVKVCRKNIAKKDRNALPNGLICLKGGDISAETRPYKNAIAEYDLTTWFDDPWFKEKKLIYLPLR
ncbi:MAG: 16S rRNA (guanine(527)-N(7))-methyltransferase RsmG [Paludibacteraceae bacterium]|nr:16S rRNA (guanine(527)-N(7))-methyltransferase RsmG [Paludibacteraceae bacterium]